MCISIVLESPFRRLQVERPADANSPRVVLTLLLAGVARSDGFGPSKRSEQPI